MIGTDLCVNKSQFVPVIFEPPCINVYGIISRRKTFIFQAFAVVRNIYSVIKENIFVFDHLDAQSIMNSVFGNVGQRM